MSFKMALITGTGMGELFSPSSGENNGLPTLKKKPKIFDETEYGGPIQAHIVRGNGLEFVWVDRHYSTGRYCCPHELNPAAYIKALYDLGAKFISATTAVGDINRFLFNKIGTGSVVVPKDFIDFMSRSFTFANENHCHPTAFYRSPRHLFCPTAAKLLPRESIQHGGIYTSIAWPRYETPAELTALLKMHPKVRLLGMTASQEAPLAREISAHYVPIGICDRYVFRKRSGGGDSGRRSCLRNKD